MGVQYFKHAILIIYLITNFSVIKAQETGVIDSLKIELNKAVQDTARAKLFEKIANQYSLNANYLKSIEAYLQAQKIYIKFNNKINESEMYNLIGAQYYYLKNWDQAIEYWSEALKLAKQLNNIEDQARYMNNIGLIYEKRDENVKALDYQTRALIIKQEIGDSLSISRSLNNIAMIYEKTNRYEKAIEFYKKSLLIKRSVQDYNGLILVLQNLGYTYYNKKKDYKQAIKYIDESLTLAKETHSLYSQKEAYLKLGDIYAYMKKYKKANDYILLGNKLKDSLYQMNNAKLIAEMDAKFDSEKKDNEIALQQIEIEKQNTEVQFQTTQKIWFAIGLFLSLILLFVAYRGFKQKQKANLLLEEKSNIIEEKNKDITDSITYARNIQQSILPDSTQISKALSKHFIFFKPKDIVSGDFYWFHEKEEYIFIIAADCTGHGVPGAFVSMLCNNALNQTIIEQDLNNPGEILTQVNKSISASLKKKESNFTSSDGMDCSLCVINKKTNDVSFSGAYNQLVIINEDGIDEIKADRTPIGGRTDIEFEFKSNDIKNKDGSCYYLFSDGYADQFGGPKGKKFMVKKLKQMFTDIHQLPFEQQHKHLDETLTSWMGDIEQVDDILVIGFKI